MDKKIKKADSSGTAPYAGSGKLTDYKKDGSWMMNQMEKGYDKVQRGITVNKSDDGIKFAKIASRIIKAYVDFKIDKVYKRLENGLIALKWSLAGSLCYEISLSQINILNELLMSEVDSDLRKFSYDICEYKYCGDAVIDFSNHDLHVEYLLQAKDSFKEEELKETLVKIGFKELSE